MFGVTNCALLAVYVGYFTLALPLERKQRTFEPQLKYEVIKQGPLCEMPAKMGDNVKVTIRELNVETEREPQVTIQFELGDAKMPGLDDALVGMCPEDTRRLAYDLQAETDDPRYSAIYEVELVSIGNSDMALPPEMDTNGDNVLSKDELTSYINHVVSQVVPQQRIDKAFLMLDSNGNGVLEFNEIKPMLSAK